MVRTVGAGEIRILKGIDLKAGLLTNILHASPTHANSISRVPPNKSFALLLNSKLRLHFFNLIGKLAPAVVACFKGFREFVHGIGDFTQFAWLIGNFLG